MHPSAGANRRTRPIDKANALPRIARLHHLGNLLLVNRNGAKARTMIE
jgi:hypothetical protein